MSDKNTSTLQSLVDSATSSVQTAIGAVTGNPADKQQAQDKRDKAEVEDSLSHASAKAGPFTVTPSGVAKDDPNRTEGSWNQTMGLGKEAIGNLVGSESLKQEGARQNQEGKGQEAQGQLSDLAAGISDRATGTIGSAVASLTGNEDAKKGYDKQHDHGKTAQRGVEADLQKQADV